MPAVRQRAAPGRGGRHGRASSDLRAAVAELRAGGGVRGEGLVTGEKEVVCQNCGGRTTFTGTLTSTRCPYCATPIQRDDVHDAPERLPVDGVLPVHRRPHGRHRGAAGSGSAAAGSPRPSSRSTAGPAPSRASTPRTSPTTRRRSPPTPASAGTPTPSRSAPGRTSAPRSGSAGPGAPGRSGSTSTTSRWPRTTASTARHVAALEPWPLGQVQPFSPEFLAGHLSRTYDHDVDACFVQARAEMERVDRHRGPPRHRRRPAAGALQGHPLGRDDLQAPAAADLAARGGLEQPDVPGARSTAPRARSRASGPTARSRSPPSRR